MVLHDILGDEVHHAGVDLAQGLALRQHAEVVAAAGPEAVQGDREFHVVRDFLALIGQRDHLAAGIVDRLDRVADAVDHVVVVVLRLGSVEDRRDGDQVAPDREVFRALLQIRAQDSAGDLLDDQRVGIGIGGDQAAHRDGLREAGGADEQRSGGQIRAGRLHLHHVQEGDDLGLVEARLHLVLDAEIQSGRA